MNFTFAEREAIEKNKRRGGDDPEPAAESKQDREDFCDHYETVDIDGFTFDCKFCPECGADLRGGVNE